MPYVTKSGNVAADLEEKKLQQRMELCKLLEKAREAFPELRDISDTDVVRVIFRKALPAKNE